MIYLKFNYLIRFLGFISVFVVSVANAVPITISLTGSVTDWDGVLGSQFSVGDSLIMEYSYDSNAIDTSVSSAVGTYGLSDFSGTLGSYSFRSSAGLYALYPDPTPTPFGDQIFAYGGASLVGNSVSGARLVASFAWFRDFDGDLLADDSLITIAPDLAVMERTGFALGFDTADGQRILVRATIDTAVLTGSAISEPIPIVLMGLGLLCLGLVNCKKMNRDVLKPIY